MAFSAVLIYMFRLKSFLLFRVEGVDECILRGALFNKNRFYINGFESFVSAVCEITLACMDALKMFK
jgi:hypothetical protein